MTLPVRDVSIRDVAILGSGPAAWACASACCQAGLSVTLIAPSPDADWPQTYGVWVDQIDASVRSLFGLGLHDSLPFRHEWSSIAARTDRAHDLQRTYGLLNNTAVRQLLCSAALSSGLLTVRVGAAEHVEHDEWSTVSTTNGPPIRARLVVDATGSDSPFVRRAHEFSSSRRIPDPGPTSAPGQIMGDRGMGDREIGSNTMQAAYGVIAQVDRAPYVTSVLMDWTGPDRRDASFLYALDFGDRWLLEETSLARNPALTPNELRARLYSRLDSMGVRILNVYSEEHVLFPMDIALPVFGQRILAIGAAGALVHPATGYSVAGGFRLAPRLASSLRKAFVAPSADAQSIADAGWKVVWPADRRKARNLETYGMQRLLAMNQSETRSFFDTFFSLGPTVMMTYLGGEASSAELAAVMGKVFRKAPWRVRLRLASGNPLTLARTLIS